jgi:hypothetical protein
MMTPMISHVSRQVQRLMEKLDDNASLTGQCVFAGARRDGGPVSEMEELHPGYGN